MVPRPALERLCALLPLLNRFEDAGRGRASSQEIGDFLGVKADTVRRDIHYLGEVGSSQVGYPVKNLRDLIRGHLGLKEPLSFCLVGLESIGMALLESAPLFPDDFSVVAAFDTDVNRMEMLNTSVPLYPFHSIPEVIRENDISLAVLSVKPELLAEAIEKLSVGGAKGILNASTIGIPIAHESIAVRNLDVSTDLRILKAIIHQQAPESKQ